MIGAFGTTLFFALTAIFANRAAKALGSTVANFWRLLVAVAILGIWAHTASLGLGGAASGWFFVSGLAGFGLGGVAMFQALPRLGSNLAMLIVQCCTVLVAASGEWLWLGTRLTPAQIALAALTMVGVTIGLLPKNLPKVGPSVLRLGIAWAFVSAAGQGIGAVLSRKAFMVARAANELPDAGTSAYQRAVAGLLVAIVAVCIARLRRRGTAAESIPFRAIANAWPWVLANAATGPILGVTCYQWALSTTPAGIVQPIVATSPLVTIPLAAWLEGSRPRAGYYLGALLAVAGVAGLYLAR